MANKKEIFVILSPGFPANENDSTCLPFIQTFVRRFAALNSGIEIMVLSFQYPFCEKKYRWNGISVIPFNGQNKQGWNRLWLWRKVWVKLKGLRKENNIIGMLSLWLGECAFVCNFVAKKYTIPHYTWLQGQDAKPGNKYFSRIKPTADSLIALSDFMAGQLKDNYQLAGVKVIPVGIDTSKYQNNCTNRSIDIMGVGSLIPLKQFGLFIEIVSQLVKKIPALKVVLLGEGPERKQLENKITELRLQSHIEVKGAVPNEEVLLIMQQAKILLHTSLYEGFGAVLAEALFAGMHVVSFCKPMKAEYEHFHHIMEKETMVQKLTALLTGTGLHHEPVLVSSIDDVCKSMAALYPLLTNKREHIS